MRRFLSGLLVGMAVGGGCGLAVALFVSDLDAPKFSGHHRTNLDDEAEARRNEGWNPNHTFWPVRVMPPMPRLGGVTSAKHQDLDLEQGLPIADAPAAGAPGPAKPMALPLVESRVAAGVESAENIVRELNRRGLDARLVRNGPDILVRLGPYDGMQQAQQSAQALKSITGAEPRIRSLD